MLFIDSGGIPEYCNGFGVKFDNNNFKEKFEEMFFNYDVHLNNMTNYPFNSYKMCQEYLSLFNKLLEEKNRIITSRNINNLEVSNFYSYKLKNLLKKLLIKLNFKK